MRSFRRPEHFSLRASSLLSYSRSSLSMMHEIYRKEKCITRYGQFSVIIGWCLTIDRAPVGSFALCSWLCSFSSRIPWKSHHCSAFSRIFLFQSERITGAKERELLRWVVIETISKKCSVTPKNNREVVYVVQIQSNGVWLFFATSIQTFLIFWNYSLYLQTRQKRIKPKKKRFKKGLNLWTSILLTQNV